MNRIERLLENPPVMLDGAMGTMLQALGLPRGAPPEIWTLERPDEVRGVSEAYAREGAAVVLTNSFGANRARLRKYSLHEKVVQLNVDAARLASKGAGRDVLVGGSVGPTGLCTGIDPPPEEELRDIFEEQCAALKEGGVDALVLETFYDAMEFRAALSAASFTKIPFIGLMTFQETPRGFFTMMGVKPSEALDMARENGATAAGANCTLGSGAMVRLAAELVSQGRGPVAVSPNAGMPELEGERTVYRQSPVEFARDITEAVGKGAAIVGGCCGTTPEFIREMAAALTGEG